MDNNKTPFQSYSDSAAAGTAGKTGRNTTQEDNQPSKSVGDVANEKGHGPLFTAVASASGGEGGRGGASGSTRRPQPPPPPPAADNDLDDDSWPKSCSDFSDDDEEILQLHQIIKHQNDQILKLLEIQQGPRNVQQQVVHQEQPQVVQQQQEVFQQEQQQVVHEEQQQEVFQEQQQVVQQERQIVPRPPENFTFEKPWIASAKCLMCDDMFDLADIMMHMIGAHSFCVSRLITTFGMDQLDFIKMVNWLRDVDKQNPLSGLHTDPNLAEVKDFLLIPKPDAKEAWNARWATLDPIWSDDKWLVPTVLDDMLLTYSVEDGDPYYWTIKHLRQEVASAAKEAEACRAIAAAARSSVKDATAIDNALGDYIETLNLNQPGPSSSVLFLKYPPGMTKEKEAEIHAEVSDANLTKEELKRTLERVRSLGMVNASDEERLLCAEEVEKRLLFLYKRNQQMTEVMNRITETVASRQGQSPVPELSSDKDNDKDKEVPKEEEYFESYDALDIHAEMLKDYPRTLAYQRAIMNNTADFKGKTVLDLGCGTGILSMFCADAGAEKVFAVDVSKMIYDAMAICYENNRHDKVTFLARKLETIRPDELEKVDILISEFMGYFLLFEGMTNSFIYARDHFLKPGGQLYPNLADMFLVAVSDEENYKETVEIWDNIHGYKMAPLKEKVLKEAYVTNVKYTSVVSGETVIKCLDLHSCQVSDLIIDDVFYLHINRTCHLTGICGYFSVGFHEGGNHSEILSTGPHAPSTHWKQVLFYLPKKLPVVAGQKLGIKFSCKPHPEFERWLKIDFKVASYECSFELK